MSLADLAARLARVAAGESEQTTLHLLAADIESEAREAISDHTRSGNSASTVAVTTTANGVVLSAPHYLKFHAWWPFRDGLKAKADGAAKTLAAETAKLLAGG